MDQESSKSGSVGLDAILITDALGRRRPRAAEPIAENRALHALARQLSEGPDTMLKALAATALDLCRGGSAGVSLLEPGDRHGRLRRASVVGAFERYEGGTAPYHSSPSGDCLERGSPQLYAYPARYFPSCGALEPLIVEVIVVPLLPADSRWMGTLWVASHEEERRFDSEDLRVMMTLADLAIAALRLERLTKAEQRRLYFLPHLAHEFKRPLTLIHNAFDQMKGDDQNGLVLEALRGITEPQIVRMAGLVDDVLDFERMARGQDWIHRVPIDLAELVRKAVDPFRRTSAEQHLHWNVTIPEDPIPLEADPFCLGRALGKLLDNAVHYNDPGGQIWLEVEQEGDTSVIRLRNTGWGIDPDMLPLVFEPFVDVECRTEQCRRGLGLGLTLAWAIIEQHGGSITAQSEGRGQNSEFIVRLPVSDRAGGSGQVEVLVPSSSEKRPCRRILIVDGNVEITRLLARCLAQHWGHEVRVAHDGPSALEEAKSFAPEFVLLSFDLPGIDACEFARRLRAHAGPAGMCVVALLHLDSKPDVRELGEQGFDRYFVKPLDVLDIQNLLAGAAGPGAST